MKKVLLGLVVGVLLGLTITVFAASYTATTATFGIFVNGEKFENAEAVVINSRTYLPVRALSEAMGVPINWNESLRRVEIGTEKVESIYNRNNPAPLNELQNVTVSNIMDNYTAEVKIIETIRGDAAWQIVKSASEFNREPKAGHDYLLVKTNYKLIQVKDDKALDLGSYDFKLYSNDNKEYDTTFGAHIPDELNTKLYAGGSTEGWLLYEVALTDSAPKIGYGQKYDGTGGVWFKAY